MPWNRKKPKPSTREKTSRETVAISEVFQNGEYVRAAESGTEANYSMIDGVVNNLEPNDKETSQEQEKPQQRDPNAPRESVIKKLRTKQLQIAKDSRKPIPKHLLAFERELK